MPSYTATEPRIPTKRVDPELSPPYNCLSLTNHYIVTEEIRSNSCLEVANWNHRGRDGEGEVIQCLTVRLGPIGHFYSLQLSSCKCGRTSALDLSATSRPTNNRWALSPPLFLKTSPFLSSWRSSPSRDRFGPIRKKSISTLHSNKSLWFRCFVRISFWGHACSSDDFAGPSAN